MSKSDPNPKSRILITDSREEIDRKIKSALTDSTEGVSHDPVARPGVSNLVSIMFHLSSEGHASPSELARSCENLSMRAFKEAVAESVDAELREIRGRYQEILARDNGRYLQTVAEEGAMKARASAAFTMADVRAAIGL